MYSVVAPRVVLLQQFDFVLTARQTIKEVFSLKHASTHVA